MEVTRIMLAIAGKFPFEGAYVDGRFQAPPTEGLTANLGRMPVLELDGRSIGQSSAIYHYIASENGLLGENTWEAAQIIAIKEHLKEMYDVYSKMIPWGSQPTQETIDMWHDGGSTDISGPADRSGYNARYLTWWMGRIEAALGDNGLAVGNKLSLADILLYDSFAEYLRPNEIGVGDDGKPLPPSLTEPFCDKARTDAKLAKHPKIKRCCEAVANHPNVQKWLANRGSQEF